MATDNLLLFPPDKVQEFYFAKDPTPTSSNIVLIYAFLFFKLTPLKSVKMSKCSSGVNKSNKMSC